MLSLPAICVSPLTAFGFMASLKLLILNPSLDLRNYFPYDLVIFYSCKLAIMQMIFVKPLTNKVMFDWDIHIIFF